MIVRQLEKPPAITDDLNTILVNIEYLIIMVENDDPCVHILRKFMQIQQSLQDVKLNLILYQTHKKLSILGNSLDVSIQLKQLEELQDLFTELSRN